jgi:hypothetical protein
MVPAWLEAEDDENDDFDYDEDKGGEDTDEAGYKAQKDGVGFISLRLCISVGCSHSTYRIYIASVMSESVSLLICNCINTVNK